MNEYFNLKRFLLYFKKYVGENHRTFLLFSGIVTAVPVLFSIIVPWLQNYSFYEYVSDETIRDPFWDSVTLFYMLVFPFMGAVAGSMMYSGMHSKAGRITTLTTPASQLEMALTYFLVYVVGYTVVFYVGAFVAECVRYIATSSVVGLDKVRFMGLHRLLLFGAEPSEDVDDMVVKTVCFGIITGALSTYALGSIVWFRRSFLNTFIFMVVFSTAFTIMAFTGGLLEGAGMSILRFELDESQKISLVYWMRGIIIFFWLGLYALGYWRFRESEIINRW